MPLHASAEKQMRQGARRRTRNRTILSALKSWVKKVDEAVRAKNEGEAKKRLSFAASAFGRAASKGIIKRNTAARKISRLARRVRALSTSSQ